MFFPPEDGLDESRQKRSGIRECRSQSARDLEDCCRLDAARDLEHVGPCEAGLDASRKRTRVETLCDHRNVAPPSSINPLVSGFSPISGSGEISSGKCTPSFSDVARTPSSPDVSITRSSPTLEEHHAEDTSQLPIEESGADADEVTSPLYATGRLRDLKVGGGSTLARSRSECSIVTTTYVAVVNKGTGEDLNSYFCKDEEDFQPSSIGWTDYKHSLYLSSMEDQFVRNMFEREFCAVDLCGQADPKHTDCNSEVDSNESQLRSVHGGATADLDEKLLRKTQRNGSWRPVALNRHIVGGVSPSAVVYRNPWINRFSPSINARFNIGTVQKGVHRRQERLQSHCLTVDNRSSRIKMSRDREAFRRDDRILAEGASSLKVQQLALEHQENVPSELSKNLNGWITGGARKRRKEEQQRVVHEAAATEFRDFVIEFDGLLSAALNICTEEEVDTATSKCTLTCTLPEGSSRRAGVLCYF